jgi:hypothetical protein
LIFGEGWEISHLAGMACELWRQLGLDEFWQQRLPDGREAVSREKVLRLLVANRRSNLTGGDPEMLWTRYIQLTQIEAVFGSVKYFFGFGVFRSRRAPDAMQEMRRSNVIRGLSPTKAFFVMLWSGESGYVRPFFDGMAASSWAVRSTPITKNAITAGGPRAMFSEFSASPRAMEALPGFRLYRRG